MDTSRTFLFGFGNTYLHEFVCNEVRCLRDDPKIGERFLSTSVRSAFGCEVSSSQSWQLFLYYIGIPSIHQSWRKIHQIPQFLITFSVGFRVVKGHVSLISLILLLLLILIY